MAVKPRKLKVPDMGSVSAPEAAALGITWQVGVDEKRSLVIQTYAARDDTPSELRNLLTKITDASDYVEKLYRVRNLKLERKKMADELARQMETYSNLEEGYRVAFARRGKKGEYEPQGNEISQLNQNRANQERVKAQMTYIDTEIRVLEEQL